MLNFIVARLCTFTRFILPRKHSPNVVRITFRNLVIKIAERTRLPIPDVASVLFNLSEVLSDLRGGRVVEIMIDGE